MYILVFTWCQFRGTWWWTKKFPFPDKCSIQSISDNEEEPLVGKKIKLDGQAGSSKAVVKIQPGTKNFSKKKNRNESDDWQWQIFHWPDGGVGKKQEWSNKWKWREKGCRKKLLQGRQTLSFKGKWWRWWCRCKCNSIHFKHRNHHHKNTFMIFDYVILKLSGTLLITPFSRTFGELGTHWLFWQVYSCRYVAPDIFLDIHVIM